jgi:putative NADH-flavin reductase
VNILLVGASGRTGRIVADKAIIRGYSVTALVRPTTQEWDKRIQYIYGDPSDFDSLKTALCGQDAVISCLGQRGKADAYLLQQSSSAMIDAMHATGVSRYIVVSQALLFPSNSFIVKLLRRVLARHIADSAAMEKMLQLSDLRWTIVRPPRLTKNGRSAGYRKEIDTLPIKAGSLQYGDLATCLVDLVEDETSFSHIIGVAGPL